MLGLLFLLLALAAGKITAWQLGLLAGFLGTNATPDYTLAALSLTATLIFMGLAVAERVPPGPAQAWALSKPKKPCEQPVESSPKNTDFREKPDLRRSESAFSGNLPN